MAVLRHAVFCRFIRLVLDILFIRRQERSVVLHDTGILLAPMMARSTASALVVRMLHAVWKCVLGLLLSYGILLLARCLELTIHCIWLLANFLLLSAYWCISVNLRDGATVSRWLRVNLGLNYGK